MDPENLSMLMSMFGGASGGGGGAWAPDYAGGGQVPLSNFGVGSGASGGGGLGGSSPLSQILGGIFGNSGGPYKDAMKQFKKYYGQAKDAQNPFYQAGIGGMENFQKWLGGMQDPSGFINKLMGGYQESPWAHNLQQASMRAGTNAASMGGLPNGMGGAGIGSTPFAQQMQQNAGNISSQDQNQWLQNVLGVNTQYGAGQNQLMQGGQNAANMLSQLAMMMGNNMGAGAYGQKAGQNQDWMSMFSGLFG